MPTNDPDVAKALAWLEARCGPRVTEGPLEAATVHIYVRELAAFRRDAAAEALEEIANEDGMPLWVVNYLRRRAAARREGST